MTNTTRTPELIQKLQEALRFDEEICWSAFPNPAKRAKQASMRTLFSSWFMIRLLLLSFLLLSIFFPVGAITDAFFLRSFGTVLLFLLLLVMIRGFFRVRAARQRVLHTLYAITTKRLIVLTRDRNQYPQNAYYPSDLGPINLIERTDGWGDIVIGGQQRVLRGFSVTPRLAGIEHVRDVASLLTQLKEEHHLERSCSSDPTPSSKERAKKV